MAVIGDKPEPGDLVLLMFDGSGPLVYPVARHYEIPLIFLGICTYESFHMAIRSWRTLYLFYHSSGILSYQLYDTEHIQIIAKYADAVG